MHQINTVADNPLARRGRPLTLGTIALLGGLAALGMLSTNIMLPAFPDLARAFAVPIGELGIVLSSFFCVLAFGQLIAGPVSDHYGRLSLVIGGLVVFLAGTLLCLLAQSLEALVLGRVMQATGISVGPVLSRAVARDLFSGEDLTRALSLTMIAIASAPGFSPLLGGVIVATMGWQWIFAIVGAVTLIVGICYVLTIGETHRPAMGKRFSLALVLNDYARLAADRRFLLPTLAVSCIFGSLYAFFATAPAILITTLGFSPIAYGIFSAATVFIVFVAAIAAPWLSQRFGAHRVASFGAMAAIGAGLLLTVFTEPELAMYTASVGLLLFGMGIVTPLGSAMALGPFESQAGLASSLMGFFQMASAAGVTASTTLLNLPPLAMLATFEIVGGLLAALFLLLSVRQARGAS